jgi:hypothetical protein
MSFTSRDPARALLPENWLALLEIKVAVLRHQLKVLGRQVGRPKFRPIDPAFLTAASRHLPH